MVQRHSLEWPFQTAKRASLQWFGPIWRSVFHRTTGSHGLALALGIVGTLLEQVPYMVDQSSGMLVT